MNDKTHRAPTYKVVDDIEYAKHGHTRPHSHYNYGGREAGFGYVTYVSPSCEEIEQKLEKMLEEGWRLVACLNGCDHQPTKLIFERYNK